MVLLSVWAGWLVTGACSPEAGRVRDGGPGADPGNKRLVDAPIVDPRAADTTLWPAKPPSKDEQRAFTESADPRTGPEPRRE